MTGDISKALAEAQASFQENGRNETWFRGGLAGMGLPEFESGSRAPKARRMDQ